ncbi:hypothetical protein CK203_054912 [Vitis vinifera]|uniref:Uncharacterized protein n=1 Tax=Vitis vinifera TaxID=29760 RepID=A0A438GJ51_VITVI|nr:hypothetical protein CK203_054912 [Vitis vinifera]
MELRKDFCFVASRSYAKVAAAADDSTEKNFSRKPELSGSFVAKDLEIAVKIKILI